METAAAAKIFWSLHWIISVACCAQSFWKASAYKIGIHVPFLLVLAQFVDSEGAHCSVSTEAA